MLNLEVTEAAWRTKIRRNQTGTTAFIEKTGVNASIGPLRAFNDDVGEAAALIESGFEYVTGKCSDGGKIFRKRK